MNNKYTFIVLKDNKDLIGIVPQMPGVVAQSNDINVLRIRIKEAITVYIQTLKKEKLHIPPKLEIVEVAEVELNNE